jgi:hypothetical protein
MLRTSPANWKNLTTAMIPTTNSTSKKPAYNAPKEVSAADFLDCFLCRHDRSASRRARVFARPYPGPYIRCALPSTVIRILAMECGGFSSRRTGLVVASWLRRHSRTLGARECPLAQPSAAGCDGQSPRRRTKVASIVATCARSLPFTAYASPRHPSACHRRGRPRLPRGGGHLSPTLAG